MNHSHSMQIDKNTHGLIFDESSHYLDHLAPFCSLHGLPLIVYEESIAKIARHFYPNLKLVEKNSLPEAVISCDSRGFIETTCSASPQKLFWLPHGNSDKGWKGSFFSPLQGEIALVYGQKLIDAIHQENVHPHFIRVGNFRLEYWLKHRSFYDGLIQKTFHLPKAQNTYLYAPTWEDREGNGSFWNAFPLLAAHLPEDCTLIVKLHPNTIRLHAPKIEQWIGKYTKQNLLFLSEWMPIYPLLDLCDVYIGDMSSIGYDFLFWNRPMFFFKQPGPSHYLHRCGVTITSETIPSLFQKTED
ncbi:MAG: hypothetical protein FJZ64_02305, partial [Chlamydiae bacterium]|nr:hypothetical protein [Chlamydiota bacterium]